MKKYFLIYAVLIAYLLTLGVRVYWLSQKNGFHVDEGMTVTYANFKEYNFEYSREYTGREIKEKSFIGKSALKDALKDIKSLWKDNRDPPHTNLYYSLLRLSLTGLKTMEIKEIIFRGGVLNLLLFTVSFGFFFLIIRRLFADSELLQASLALCAFLSAATISNTVFLRPYQIQETMFIIFCYYFIRTLDFKKYVIDNGKGYISGTVILFSLITAITLMTGYYAILFIGMFGIYVIYIKCKERNYIEIKYYVLILILGFLLAQAFYNQFLAGFSSYRATETTRTVSADILRNIKFSLINAVSLLNIHLFTYPLIALCVICPVYLIVRGKKLLVPKLSLYIFIAALTYFVVTLFIAPYKILRYGMPVYPFFVLLPAILIYSIPAKEKKIQIIAAALLCFCFLPGALNKNKIENLFAGKQSEYVFAEEKDIPVYVYVHYYKDWNFANFWKYANLVPYMNDDQKYYFLEKYEDLHSTQYEEFYLVMENFWGINESNYLEDETFDILKEIKLTGGEPETESTQGYYFLCRKLKKKRFEE